MKLLLTSTGFSNKRLFNEFLRLAGKKVSEIRIILVPSASRTKKELFYVNESKKQLIELGILKDNLKILDLDHDISYDEVSDFDVLYVCGGNTFFLLDKIRKTGFDKVIKDFIKKERVYVGVSAGSIILGPDIEIAGIGDDNDIGLKDLTGLNIISSVISPHYSEKKKKAVNDFKEKISYPVIPLTDEQALIVYDHKKEIIV